MSREPSDVPRFRRGADFLLGKCIVTGDAQATDDIAMRRRRLKFRCWHRGMKEVDLLLGRFCDVHVEAMDMDAIADFEALLDIPDQVMLAWILGEEPVPPEARTPMLDRILAFHAA